METKMRVLLYLKKQEQSKDGLWPLMGRITIRGRVNSIAGFSSKIRINPTIWNSTAQRCIGKSREATAINRDIESLLLLIHRRFNELIESNEVVLAQDVKNAFQGITARQQTLLKLFQEYNDECALRVGIGLTKPTYYSYCNTYRILSEFIQLKYKGQDIAMISLDVSFIKSFDNYLREERKYMAETIIGHINRINRVIAVYIQKGIIHENPFEGYTPERAVPEELSLTMDEFERLISTSLENVAHEFVRDMFLFSSFTGLSYCDLFNLTMTHVQKHNDGSLWIKTHRQKTKTPTDIYLLPIPLMLIEKYSGSAPDDKLFPYMSNSTINEYLKKIARQCKIDRNLTFHMTRHSYATLICMENDVPLDTISKTMGHKHSWMTQRYAKVTHKKMDRDMTAAQDTISLKYKLTDIDEPPSAIRKDMSRRKYRPSKK